MIKQGDCLELMKELPDDSVDLILTDLPYGVTMAPFDVKLDLPTMWTQFNRIAKRNAAVCLFAQQPFSSELVMSNRKFFKYVWTWHKRQCSGFLNAKKQPLRSCEDVLVFYRSQCTYNPQMHKGKPYKTKRKPPFSKNYNGQIAHSIENDGEHYYPTTMLEFPLPRFKDGHPQQKPVALLEYLIKTYTNAGELVLDATMGSGSTGVAAVNTGRRFIGFETETKFYDTARRRIDEAIAKREQSLFKLEA